MDTHPLGNREYAEMSKQENRDSMNSSNGGMKHTAVAMASPS